MEILTKRPEGMTFEEYKAHRRYQNKIIGMYLKGRIPQQLVWNSTENKTLIKTK